MTTAESILSPPRNGHAPLPPRHWLRPIRPEDVPRLTALAQADDHAVIAPSHVLEKDGGMVGYASVATVPLVLTWFHTQQCKAADSLYFVNQLELLTANLLPASHHGIIGAPFGSTFQPHMARLGYQAAANLTLGFKKLR